MLTSFYSDVHGILMSSTALCKFPKKVRTSFRIGTVLLEMSHLPLFPFRRAIKRHYSGAVSLRPTSPCYIVISVSLETFPPLKQIDSDSGIVKILVALRITRHIAIQIGEKLGNIETRRCAPRLPDRQT